MSGLEWARFGFDVGAVVARVIIDAVSSGDSSVMDKRVRDILGGEMATTVAKRIADAAAEAKFGTATAARVVDQSPAAGVPAAALRKPGPAPAASIEEAVTAAVAARALPSVSVSNADLRKSLTRALATGLGHDDLLVLRELRDALGSE